MLYRMGNAAVVRAVLRDQNGRGVQHVQPGIHVAQKGHGVAVYTARRVTMPIQKAAHGVYTQAVGMVMPQPEIGAALQKTAHLGAAVHKVAAAPFADADILAGIFIQRRAVQTAQPVGVQRKMHRHKIQNHAQPVPVAGIHQAAQPGGGAVAAGGGKKTGGLIAPAAVKGMLGQGHQLNMSVAVLFAVGGQKLGQFVISIPAAVRLLPPASGVDFINGKRLIQTAGAGAHPFIVGKIIPV